MISRLSPPGNLKCTAQNLAPLQSMFCTFPRLPVLEAETMSPTASLRFDLQHEPADFARERSEGRLKSKSSNCGSPKPQNGSKGFSNLISGSPRKFSWGGANSNSFVCLVVAVIGS